MILTIEEMKALAKVERDMSDGLQPYVEVDGQRWAFSIEILDECGIVSGQRISNQMLITLMKLNLANIETKIAIKKAKQINLDQ